MMKERNENNGVNEMKRYYVIVECVKDSQKAKVLGHRVFSKKAEAVSALRIVKQSNKDHGINGLEYYIDKVES